MKDQIEKLEAFYKRCDHEAPGEDGDDFDNDGDYWEFKNPNKVESWSLHMIPWKNIISFAAKFKDTDHFFNISFDEKIKDVAHERGTLLKVRCITDVAGIPDREQYHFTIQLDSAKCDFNISHFLSTLEPTEYRTEIPDLEKKIDHNFFKTKDGKLATGKALYSRLKTLLNDFTILKAKLELKKKDMTVRTVSLEFPSNVEGQSSTGTRGTQQSQGTRKSRYSSTPPHPPRRSKLASTTAGTLKGNDSSADITGKQTFASAVTDVPLPYDSKKSHDYIASAGAYKAYWKHCTDAYIFGLEEKKSISIEQLIKAPEDLNIRSFEMKLAEDIMTYLWEMPDKSMKQTLCVMPVDCSEKPKPEDWPSLERKNFYIINGQHSVTASKMMVDQNLDEEIVANFRQWDCYVVWSTDAEKLRDISAYYNRVNHFVALKPSWSTNIMGARKVWELMGRPRNPKDAAPIATRSNVRRNAESAANKKKFTVRDSGRFDLNCEWSLHRSPHRSLYSSEA